MARERIISNAEALQILRNQLRTAEVQKRAVELDSATPERRAEIETLIDQGVESELRRQRRNKLAWPFVVN